jgi:hypothetical protein
MAMAINQVVSRALFRGWRDSLRALLLWAAEQARLTGKFFPCYSACMVQPETATTVPQRRDG